MKILRFLLNSISFILIAAAVVVLLGLHNKLPGQFRLFTVVTGSMEPAIPVGSVVISQPVTSVSALKKGDIIIFEEPGKPERMITHRIHEVVSTTSSPTFITKGDANAIPDSWRVTTSQIKGLEKYSYPHVGSFIEFLRKPLGIALFVVLPILILAISEIRNIVNIMVESRLKDILAKQSKKHVQLGITLLILCMAVGHVSAALISNTVSIDPSTITTGAKLLINEIYFFPDAAHGGDCNTAGSSSVIINQSNTNTGPGSTNTNTANVNNSSSITQNNSGTINETISGAANTGNNTTNNNGTVGTVSSGSIGINISTNNSINSGSTSSNTCDEWIELYNPNAFAVALNGWQIMDSSGTTRTLAMAQSIAPNSFALVVKNAATFSSFWAVPVGVPIIALGDQIGNGLGNVGDNLILKNPSNVVSDSISWGNDPTPPHYAGPLAQGQSLQRTPSGLDTNSGTDFTTSAGTPGI